MLKGASLARPRSIFVNSPPQYCWRSLSFAPSQKPIAFRNLFFIRPFPFFFGCADSRFSFLVSESLRMVFYGFKLSLFLTNLSLLPPFPFFFSYSLGCLLFSAHAWSRLQLARILLSLRFLEFFALILLSPPKSNPLLLLGIDPFFFESSSIEERPFLPLSLRLAGIPKLTTPLSQVEESRRPEPAYSDPFQSSCLLNPPAFFPPPN